MPGGLVLLPGQQGPRSWQRTLELPSKNGLLPTPHTNCSIRQWSCSHFGGFSKLATYHRLGLLERGLPGVGAHVHEPPAAVPC